MNRLHVSVFVKTFSIDSSVQYSLMWDFTPAQFGVACRKDNRPLPLLEEAPEVGGSAEYVARLPWYPCRFRLVNHDHGRASRDLIHHWDLWAPFCKDLKWGDWSMQIASIQTTVLLTSCRRRRKAAALFGMMERYLWPSRSIWSGGLHHLRSWILLCD